MYFRMFEKVYVQIKLNQIKWNAGIIVSTDMSYRIRICALVI